MTKRPKIRPENYEAVYDYFRQPTTNHRINAAIYQVCARLLSPDIVMTEETRETIEEQVAEGKGVFVVSNHPSKWDPFVLAGAFHETDIDALNEVGPLAKDSLLRGPEAPLFRAAASIPVFRAHKYPDFDRRQLLTVTNAALDVAALRLIDGHAVSIMPESTNSTDEALTHLSLNDLKTGVGRVARKASELHSFMLPVGVRYRHSSGRGGFNPRHAVVAFGQPITHYESTISGIRIQAYMGMQDALDQAIEHTNTTRK